MTYNTDYWKEIYRIMQMARIHSGDELLQKCLNGRPQTKQSVTQLFKLAVLHFDPHGVRERIQEACLPFLEANLSFDELQKLRNPEPDGGGILDEMAAEMAAEGDRNV